MKKQIHDIADWPFEEFAPLDQKSDLVECAQQQQLHYQSGWMLPQLLAHWGSWKLIRNERGLVDPTLTAKHNILTPKQQGMWRVATQLPRGNLIKHQSTPEMATYSALVPLILAGVKRMQGVQYQSWDLHSGPWLVDSELWLAMQYEPPPLTEQELLQIRDQGLTVKTGARSGYRYEPTKQWCLRGVQDTKLGDAPRLAQTMLTQIWCAHPTLRTPLMVLDPKQWDHTPPPLVDQQIFAKVEHIEYRPPQPATVKGHFIPWEA